MSDRPGRRSRKRQASLGADSPGERQELVPVRLVADEHVASWSPEGGYVEIQFGSGAVVRVVGEVSTARVGAVLAAVRQTC